MMTFSKRSGRPRSMITNRAPQNIATAVMKSAMPLIGPGRMTAASPPRGPPGPPPPPALGGSSPLPCAGPLDLFDPRPARGEPALLEDVAPHGLSMAGDVINTRRGSPGLFD